MAQQKQAKHGGSKKIGRDARHPCHAVYKARGIRFANKCKRVLQSNGKEALEKYKREHWSKG